MMMMSSDKEKKRKRKRSRPSIHPRNKYSETRPDFAHLASLYPTFEPFVFYTQPGRPRIDWTDFNATRELTRILLFHDHNLNWWIPDGQLCPTVPNRSNYIHWIEDLLSSDIIPKINTDNENVRGFDIGTGANCIYPLLGASLLGWSFVGSDVTDVALEWATKNVEDNPHISELIEIRKANAGGETLCLEDLQSAEVSEEEKDIKLSGTQIKEANKSYQGPPVLLGVVKDGEKFDFCMCNPPFFETMDETELNPKTSCGGTPDEMVCNGGEKAFISRIIEDSSVLKQSFRWYTSMIGRKSNLKFLIAKLWDVGVTIVKTTDFVQGQTCRWGLAWSFVPPTKKIISPQIVEKTVFSFTIEGLQRQFTAINVLQYVESFFSSSGALCKSNTALFSVDITMSNDHFNSILIKKEQDCNGASCPSSLNPSNSLSFRITIFQQIPGTLLVKGSLQQKDISVSGLFSLIFQNLEEELKTKFCRKRPI